MSGKTKINHPKILSLIIGFSVLAFVAGNVTAKAESPTTEIKVDQENSAMYFVIDGEEIAVITAEGMHVYKDISYNGMIMDGTPDHLNNGGSGE